MPLRVELMEDRRPVNLAITTIKLPITAWVSIMHRISGIGMFFGSGVLLLALYCSLGSAANYDMVRHFLLQTVSGRLLLWVVLSALAYHSCAGLRHLLMDLGWGEELESGVRGAQLVLVASALLALLSAWWLY